MTDKSNNSFLKSMPNDDNPVAFYGSKPVASLLFSTFIAGWVMANGHHNPDPDPVVITPKAVVAAPVAKNIVEKKVADDPNRYENLHKSELSQKLFDEGHRFSALAVMMEDIKTKVYYDVGGENIGMGYCVSKQLKLRGRDEVINDFKSAGISEENISFLLGSVANQKKALITSGQAVALLDIMAPSFRDAAKKWIGEEQFNKMTDNQQAALTYLSYNVGVDEVHNFKKLKKAIEKNDEQGIKKHITPYFRDGGELRQNLRMGNILSSAFKSDEHISENEYTPPKQEIFSLVGFPSNSKTSSLKHSFKM